MIINSTNIHTESRAVEVNQSDVSIPPYNAITGKDYVGAKASRFNAEADYRSHMSKVCAIVKQWNSIKKTMAKGEKGTLVIQMSKKPDGTEEQVGSLLFDRCQLAAIMRAIPGITLSVFNSTESLQLM